MARKLSEKKLLRLQIENLKKRVVEVQVELMIAKDVTKDTDNKFMLLAREKWNWQCHASKGYPAREFPFYSWDGNYVVMICRLKGFSEVYKLACQIWKDSYVEEGIMQEYVRRQREEEHARAKELIVSAIADAKDLP